LELVGALAAVEREHPVPGPAPQPNLTRREREVGALLVQSDSFRVHPARHNDTVCAPPLISFRTGGRCCVLNPGGDVTCGNEIAHVDSQNPSIVCYYRCGS
jgi:hypothetical protein